MFVRDHKHIWKSRAVSNAKKGGTHGPIIVCHRAPIQGWGRSQPWGSLLQEAMLGIEGTGKSRPKAPRWRSRVSSKNRKKVLVVGAQSEVGKFSWARPC